MAAALVPDHCPRLCPAAAAACAGAAPACLPSPGCQTRRIAARAASHSTTPSAVQLLQMSRNH
eukprot:12841480-Alexandrium_andersonii.AAC.1